jgi:hypothetical protein
MPGGASGKAGTASSEGLPMNYVYIMQIFDPA